MKKLGVWTLAFALFGITGCQVEPKATAVSTMDEYNIISGVKQVIQDLHTLQKLVAANEAEEIHSQGKIIALDWGRFEEKVEKQYPAQYEKIEAYLYPLIAETGKASFDKDRINELLHKTEQTLFSFAKQLQGPQKASAILFFR